MIANGKKTIEVRKTRPKIETPFKCYIYCTKDNTDLVPSKIWWKADETGFQHILNGKVIGEFVCNKFIPYCSARPISDAETVETQACLTRKEVWEYCPAGNPIGWHISELVIYDKPKELSEFIKPCENDLYCEICAMYSEFSERCYNAALRITRPPQSWCYVEELPGGGPDG